MVSCFFSESTLKSALSKAKHEFDLAAEMVQLIEQGMVQTNNKKISQTNKSVLVTDVGGSLTPIFSHQRHCSLISGRKSFKLKPLITELGTGPLNHFYSMSSTCMKLKIR